MSIIERFYSLMKCFTLSLSLLTPQALPTYIEKLEWGNLSKTLEVYSLLTELMEAKHFPVEVHIINTNTHIAHCRHNTV